jgi:hypothetical protein
MQKRSSLVWILVNHIVSFQRKITTYNASYERFTTGQGNYRNFLQVISQQQQSTTEKVHRKQLISEAIHCGAEAFTAKNSLKKLKVGHFAANISSFEIHLY